LVTAETNWSHGGRIAGAQRWRAPSSAMGSALTAAIVEEAQIAPGMSVLDAACGTGEPAISIAARLQGAGHVVGIDITAEALKIAAQRAQERGLANLEFRTADAHQLPFPDGSFDRVTSRLGVMFFADLSRALRELRRVLKPGGRASFLAWGPRQQPYFDDTLGTIFSLLPALRLPASGEALFKFGRGGILAAALQEAGFVSVTESARELPWNWPGKPADLWAYFQQSTAPFKPLLESIPAGRKEEVDRRVMAAFERRYDGREVRFGARVVLASGQKLLIGNL
jgi:SAM-dependent methyltransferase